MLDEPDPVDFGPNYVQGEGLMHGGIAFHEDYFATENEFQEGQWLCLFAKRSWKITLLVILDSSPISSQEMHSSDFSAPSSRPSSVI